MQYSEALGRSKARSGTRTARSGLLILARVALGECYETKSPRDGERLAPFTNPADRSLATYDSVVANMGRHREHRERLPMAATLSTQSLPPPLFLNQLFLHSAPSPSTPSPSTPLKLLSL